MKKLVYTMMLSSIAILGANAHEVWLKLDDKKNEAQLFFGHFADNQKESGEKFERIKEGVTYPKDLVKEIKRNNDNITYTLSKKSDIVVVQEGEPRKNRDTGITTKRIAYIKAGRTTTEVITAFDIVADTVGNVVIADAILVAKASIKEGNTIAKPLTESGQFPVMVTQMIEIGEESGAITEMLSKIADFNEREVEEAVSALVAAIEPMAIVLMAVLVGFIVIAMFLPMFKISDIAG